MDMFLNYQNIPNSYVPNNMKEYNNKPSSYTKLEGSYETLPYELYNAKGELEGYYWHYGSTINLDFSITGEVIQDDGTIIDAKDFLRDKTINITVYNFRFNAIYSKNFSGTDNPIFIIDSEMSKEMVKGVYYCSLTINGNDRVDTLFAPEDCKLLVK